VNSQEYKVKILTTAQDVIDWWPFFLEGLHELNQLPDKEDRVTPEEYLQTILHTATLPTDLGLVGVITSKNGKPLCYGVVMNNTVRFRRKSCCVYAVYSTKQARAVVRFALEYFEKWARENGYSVIHAFSPCMNGSRFRLFEKHWKFRRASILFTKNL